MKKRIATLDDVETIRLMYREFFDFNASLQPYYNQKAESGEYPVNTIQSETADIILVEIDGSIAGFAHVLEDKTPPYDSLVPHKFAVCMDLYVLPNYRKKGVGTTLVKAVKEWAKKRSLDYIELNVMIENENAARLYKQEEFKTVQSIMRCTL